MKYGIELILDMAGCDTMKFNRKAIREYLGRLCNLIDMEPEDCYFWDDLRIPKEKKQTNPKTKGTTAIQFILTSNITIHTLDLLGAVFVNIFSCKGFDSDVAENFTKEYFDAKVCESRLLERNIP